MVFYMRGTRKYTETTRFITDDTRIGLSTAEKHPITYDVLFPRVVGRIPEDSSKPIWYQGWNEFKSWETEFSRDVPYEHAIEASPGQTLYCKTFIYYGDFVSGYTSTVSTPLSLALCGLTFGSDISLGQSQSRVTGVDPVHVQG
jgi:hypothetical protein